MAKVVRIHAFGGPEVLRLDEVDVGTPGTGEVRIRVAAFGLNRVEAIYRSGQFGPVSFPAKIGYEAAGIVEAVGDGVSEWSAGDRVATLYGQSIECYGTNGEVILYPADRLVAVPPGLSLVDAAASWMQYGTAYALIGIADIKRGDAVVITAASSSVGLAAIQMAWNHAAIPIAVTRSRTKAERLRELGAAHVIVGAEENVAERILELTGGAGARVLFDAVGGEPLTALLPSVRREGTAIVYGMLAGHSVELALPTIMMMNLTLRGWSADLFIQTEARRRELISYIGDRLADGRLAPIIAKTFPLSDIAEAHCYLEGNSQIGKVVVVTDMADA